MTTPVFFQGTLPIEDGGTPVRVHQGIPLTADGRVPISIGGLESYSLNGIPFDSLGRCVVEDNGDDSRLIIGSTPYFLRSDGEVEGFYQGLPFGEAGGSIGPSFPEWVASGSVANATTIAQVSGTIGEEVEETIFPAAVLYDAQLTNPHPTSMRTAYSVTSGYFITAWIDTTNNALISYRILHRAENGTFTYGLQRTLSFSRTIRDVDICWDETSDKFFIGVCVQAASSTSHYDIRATQMTINGVNSVSTSTYNLDTSESNKSEMVCASHPTAGFIIFAWEDIALDNIQTNTIAVNSSGYTSIGGLRTLFNGSEDIFELSAISKSWGDKWVIAWRTASDSNIMGFEKTTATSSYGLGSVVQMDSENDSYVQSIALGANSFRNYVSYYRSSGTTGVYTKVYSWSGNNLVLSQTVVSTGNRPTSFTVDCFGILDQEGDGKLLVLLADADDSQNISYFTYDTAGGGGLLSNQSATVRIATGNTVYARWAYDAANGIIYGSYEEFTDADVIAYQWEEQSTTNSANYAGISQSAAADGENFFIANSGLVAQGLTGLTQGVTYYVDADGSLTTTNTGVVAGVAQSSTTLLVS